MFEWGIGSITFSGGETISLESGSVLIIVGPNSSGKSTALRQIEDMIHNSSRPQTVIQTVHQFRTTDKVELRLIDSQADTVTVLIGPQSSQIRFGEEFIGFAKAPKGRGYDSADWDQLSLYLGVHETDVEYSGVLNVLGQLVQGIRVETTPRNVAKRSLTDAQHQIGGQSCDSGK